ncbi:MAG TPA: hypothetical protein PKA27_16605 [Fimbriimonadaceae bacterium]|nr:hypothetical protein [Fimbriimonadaceae bacterium]
MAEKKVYRDAGTGEYVKKSYADKHPKTTVSEPARKPTRPPAPKKSK